MLLEGWLCRILNCEQMLVLDFAIPPSMKVFAGENMAGDAGRLLHVVHCVWLACCLW